MTPKNFAGLTRNPFEGLSGMLGGALSGLTGLGQSASPLPYMLPGESIAATMQRMMGNMQRDMSSFATQALLAARRNGKTSLFAENFKALQRAEEARKFPHRWQFKSGSMARMTSKVLAERLCDVDAPRVYRAFDRSLGSDVYYEAR